MSFLINDPSYKIKRRTLRRNQTNSEHKLWQFLKNRQFNGLKFYRQYSIGAYILDFYCPQKLLAIELDGGQHIINEKYDEERTNFINALGIKVIRFWNHEALQKIEGVLEVIANELKR